MTSEPTHSRSRPRLALASALAWPVAGMLAMAMAGCSGTPRIAGPSATPDRLIPTGWVVRGQSPDPVPPPPAPGPSSAPPMPLIQPLPADSAGPLVGVPIFPAVPEKLAPGWSTGAATPGCATCGGVGQVPAGEGQGFKSCSTCKGSGCVPGRKVCYPYESNTFFGRLCADLYASLCCPDPCYEPSWVPQANAAFFLDTPRPRTIQRLRNDYGWGLQFPDRNEYFWAREQIQRKSPPSASGTFTSIPGGTGPGRPSRFPKNLPFLGQPSVNYDQFSFYNEVASSSRASLFVEIPYRTVSPRYGGFHAGFSDVNTGFKGVILDSEILLMAIQFKTFAPSGNASFGLGTGHVSLEPSLLGSLKLGPDSYLQFQLAEWIPIGGDNNYQGAIIHYHGSYNQVLCRFAPNSPLIFTLEGNGYSFQDGAYTNPSAGPYVKSNGSSYLSLGPGLRAVICDAVDFGGAIAAPITDHHWGDPLFRIELRILY